jgi:hypothetical protein
MRDDQLGPAVSFVDEFEQFTVGGGYHQSARTIRLHNFSREGFLRSAGQAEIGADI